MSEHVGISVQRPGGLIEEALSGSVLGAFYAVHRKLGYGFLESIYARALQLELEERGHRVAREVVVPIHYGEVLLAHQRLDLIVDRKLVVEIKSTEVLHPKAHRQVFNYLRATNLEVGLLLHFGHEPKFYREVCQRRG